MDILDSRKYADFFKALSHPIRLEMVMELLKGKKCVSDIKELVKVRQPNISQHLSLLKFNGIVDWCQEGKRKCYFLKNPQVIKKALEIFKKNV